MNNWMIGNWSDVSREAFFGGVSGGALVVLCVFAAIVCLAAYIYFALALSTIGKKLRYKHSWLAWIPFANTAMFLQLGGFPWGWVFLYLAPIIGWIALFIMMIIASWAIFEKRNYPGWLSLLLLLSGLGGLAYMIVLGFVAWKDRRKR